MKIREKNILCAFILSSSLITQIFLNLYRKIKNNKNLFVCITRILKERK